METRRGSRLRGRGVGVKPGWRPRCGSPGAAATPMLSGPVSSPEGTHRELQGPAHRPGRRDVPRSAPAAASGSWRRSVRARSSARAASSAAVPTSAPAYGSATTSSCRTTPSSTSPPSSATASSSAPPWSSPTTSTRARSTPTASRSAAATGRPWASRSPRAPRSARGRSVSRRYGSAAGRMVAAGAVVTKDVPDFALVVGVPARRIGWVGRAGVRLVAREGEPGVWECPQSGAVYEEVGRGPQGAADHGCPLRRTAQSSSSSRSNPGPDHRPVPGRQRVLRRRRARLAPGLLRRPSARGSGWRPPPVSRPPSRPGRASGRRAPCPAKNGQSRTTGSAPLAAPSTRAQWKLSRTELLRITPTSVSAPGTSSVRPEQPDRPGRLQLGQVPPEQVVSRRGPRRWPCGPAVADDDQAVALVVLPQQPQHLHGPPRVLGDDARPDQAEREAGVAAVFVRRNRSRSMALAMTCSARCARLPQPRQQSATRSRRWSPTKTRSSTRSRSIRCGQRVNAS